MVKFRVSELCFLNGDILGVYQRLLYGKPHGVQVMFSTLRKISRGTEYIVTFQFHILQIKTQGVSILFAALKNTGCPKFVC